MRGPWACRFERRRHRPPALEPPPPRHAAHRSRRRPGRNGVVSTGACHLPPLEDAEDALVGGDRTYTPGSARAALSHPVFRRMFAIAFLSSTGIWTQNVVLGA